MNSITPYEQLLAQEMEHLPLPDSMENIWTEIETRLDVELPAGGGKNPPPRKPAPARRTTGVRWTRHWRLFVIVGAITMVLLVMKNRNRHQDDDKDRLVVPPQEIVIPDSPAQQAAPTPAANDKRIQPSSVKPSVKDSPSFMLPDSPSLIPSPVPILDTNAGKPANSPVINPGPPTGAGDRPPGVDSIKTTPPGKKSRGMKGLDDPDYRLVPVRKDTPKGG